MTVDPNATAESDDFDQIGDTRETADAGKPAEGSAKTAYRVR